MIIVHSQEKIMKKSRGRKGRVVKPVSRIPETYRDPLTGVYAFPASFGESFAERIRIRFAKK